MQWLKLVSEDGGVQRLKAVNRLPARAPHVDAVPAYPATRAARSGEYPEPGRRPRKDRRKNERRQGGERRKKQVPVVLDTRSKHDRRALENRRDGNKRCEDKTPAPRSGINVYA